MEAYKQENYVTIKRPTTRFVVCPEMTKDQDMALRIRIEKIDPGSPRGELDSVATHLLEEVDGRNLLKYLSELYGEWDSRI